MAKYISFPLNDTYYTAEAEQLYNSNRTNGIFSANDEFLVTVKNGMTVVVSPGRAWISKEKFKGFAFGSIEPVDLTFDIGDSVLNRIDRIIIRHSIINNNTELKVLKGTPSNIAVGPSITRNTTTYYDLCIAEVNINAGTVIINQSMITDKRLDENLCGVVKDGIESIPTQALQNQWESWFNTLTTKGTTDWNNWFNSNKILFGKQFTDWFFANTNKWVNDFNNWFDSVKNKLSGDVGTKLASDILNLESNYENFFKIYNEENKIINTKNIQNTRNSQEINPLSTYNYTGGNSLNFNSLANIDIGTNYTNYDSDLQVNEKGIIRFKTTKEKILENEAKIKITNDIKTIVIPILDEEGKIYKLVKHSGSAILRNRESNGWAVWGEIDLPYQLGRERVVNANSNTTNTFSTGGEKFGKNDVNAWIALEELPETNVSKIKLRAEKYEHETHADTGLGEAVVHFCLEYYV